MNRTLLSVFFLFAACAAFAQIVAVRAGHLVDPATASVSDDQVILIQDGKITAVGASVQIPSEAQVIDVSHDWVMPGLVDAHTHITQNLPPNPPGESLWESYIVRESTGLRVARGLRNAQILLDAGFLCLRDVGNSADYADTAMRQAIERGWFPGPTIMNSGKIIAPFGGQTHDYAPEQGRFWSIEYIDADTPDEIRKAVHQNIYYGAKLIKLAADNSSFHYTEQDIHAAADEAHRAGLAVAVHVYGGQAARDAINGGADSIEHGFDLTDDLLQLMKSKGTYLVGTDFPYEHLVALGAVGSLDAKETSRKIIDRLIRAHKIGVKMAFGSDVVVDLPGKTRADMAFDYIAIWQKAGIPAPDILRAFTTNGFELLRLDKERGPITPGRAGDLIAVPGNPLQDIQVLRKVNFVMKDGKVIKGPIAVNK
jgi:imidazolonepropionase-like amidohydrolase